MGYRLKDRRTSAKTGLCLRRPAGRLPLLLLQRVAGLLRAARGEQVTLTGLGQERPEDRLGLGAEVDDALQVGVVAVVVVLRLVPRRPVLPHGPDAVDVV